MTASFAVLFIEVSYYHVLQFLTSYLDATRAIAIALLGVSLGGLLGFLLARFGDAVLRMALFLLPVSAIAGMACAAFYVDYGIIQIVALTVPFVLGSLIISSVFSRRRAFLIYFADLTGAGLGALAAAILIPLIREEGCIFFVALAVQVIAVVLARRAGIEGAGRHVFVTLGAVLSVGLLVLFVLHIALDPFNLVKSGVESTRFPDKMYAVTARALAKQAENPKAKVMPLRYSRGSLVERIDVFWQEDLKWYQVAYNGLLNDHVSAAAPKSHYYDIRVPNCWTETPADVLVIGTAAEGVTKPAIAIAGEGDLVGLEINPAIVDVVLNTPIHDFGKRFYEGFDLHVLDARTYFARTDKQFDIITMANTHRIRTLGHIGPPDYLHTAEALDTLLRHLEPTGFLAVEERNINDLAEAGISRFLLTVREALLRAGQQRPEDCVVVYEFYPGGKKGRRGSLYAMVMVRPTPFDADDNQAFLEWSDHPKTLNRGKRTLMVRHLPGSEGDHVYSRLLRGEDPAHVLAGRDVVITPPPTDDRPFPYDVYPDRPEVVRMLTIVLSAAGLMVFLPLLIGSVARGRRGRVPGPVAGFSIFAGVVGLAYIIVEIVFIEWLSKYLGSPGRSLILVLPTMLIASGLGGLWSGGLTGRGRTLAMAAILPLLAVTALAMPFLLEVTQGLPFFFRALVAAILLFPVSFVMGTPLPFAIDRIKHVAAPQHGAIVFGINGGFGAVATPIAIFSSMEWGFFLTLMGAIALYALAILPAAIASRGGAASEAAPEAAPGSSPV